MQLIKFWFTTLSLFSLAVSGSAILKRETVGEKNYKVIEKQKALPKNLVNYMKFGLYEYWLDPSGWCTDVTKHFSHAALVVVTYKDIGGKKELNGQRYELRKDGEGGVSGTGVCAIGSSAGHGAANGADVNYSFHLENWEAKSEHKYELAGEVGESTNLDIREFGKDFCKAHPEYNAIKGITCQKYAGDLFKTIRKPT